MSLVGSPTAGICHFQLGFQTPTIFLATRILNTATTFFSPPLNKGNTPPSPQHQSNDERQSTGPTVGLRELGSLGAGELQLLEGDDDGTAGRHHEAQDEPSLLLIAAAGFVHPAGEYRREAPVAAVEYENKHPQGVRHVPDGEYDVVENQQGAHQGAGRAARAYLVRHESRGRHEHKVDAADGRGDVVYVRHAEAFLL